MTKIYWLVTEGGATPATGDDDLDGVESVMAYAETAADALELARRYDAGKTWRVLWSRVYPIE